MLQCSAVPMRIAYSTAISLRTGSEPGRPRQTGQMLVFGSLPKAFAAAAEQLGRGAQLAVDLEPDDDLPVGSSRSVAPPTAAAGRSPSRSRRRPGTSGSLREPGASTCTPTGSPSAPVPNGTLIAGWPARFDGIVHRSDRYIASGSAVLAPSAKAIVGVVGAEQDVEGLVGGLEVAE